MSSSSSSRPCVVCGVATSNRCGDCAANGTDWMFFCSREHQKLVWFMHRRVCGKNSSPFRWPGLSEKEIEDSVQLATRTARLPGENVNGRWIDIFARDHRLPLDEGLWQHAWRKHLEALAKTPKDQDQSWEKSIEIIQHRSYSYQFRNEAVQYEDPSSDPSTVLATVAREHPMDYFAFLFERARLHRFYEYEWDWTSDFQHRQLISTALFVGPSLSREEGSLVASQAYKDYTIEQVRQFVKDRVEPTQDRLAKHLLELLPRVEDFREAGSEPLDQMLSGIVRAARFAE